MSDIIAEKEEVKKIIRSLLISAPNGLTAEMLASDYKDMMSSPLPFRKFGFFNTTDFARSLSDVLYTSLRNNEYVFYAIANEETKHILKMVQSQKKPKVSRSLLVPPPKKRGNNRFKRPLLCHMWPSAFTRTGILKVVRAHSDGISLSKLPLLFRELNGVDINPEELKNIQSSLLRMPDIARLEFGRREKNGNNLYLYPSKNVLDYKTLVKQKVCLRQSAIDLKLRDEAAVTTSVTATPTISTGIAGRQFYQARMDKYPHSMNNSKHKKDDSAIMEVEKDKSGANTKFDLNQNTNNLYSPSRLKNTENTKLNQPVPITKGLQTTASTSKTKPENEKEIFKKSQTQAMPKMHTGKNIAYHQNLTVEKKERATSESSKPFSKVSSPKLQNLKPSQNMHASSSSCKRESLSSRSKHLDVFDVEITPSSMILQEEIIEVLTDITSGTHAVELASLYKKKFNKELDLHKYGYFSIIEFISTMSDRVSVCKVNRSGGWILKLRSFMSEADHECNDEQEEEEDDDEYLQEVESDLKELLTRFKSGIVVKSLEDIFKMHFTKPLLSGKHGLSSIEALICQIVDKVVLIDGNIHLVSSTSPLPALIPSPPITSASPFDAVGSGACYKSPVIPKAEWGYFDCYVCHITSPGSFSIQVISDQTTRAFDLLTDEMAKVYAPSCAKAYKMPEHLMHVDQVCVTIFHGDNNWNRAIITDEPRDGFVKILYVDYGDVAAVSVNSLYLLKSKFFDLPALMVRARLSYVQPANLEIWDFEAKKVMLEICRNKPLVAMVTDVDKLDVVSLLLCDTTQSATTDIYINDVLIDMKLAALVEDGETPLKKEILEKRDDANQTTSKPLATNSIPIETPPYQACDNKTLASKITQSEASDKSSEEENLVRVEPKSCKLQQTRFVQPFKVTDSKHVHLINYNGNALLSSGDISSLFRTIPKDIVVSMLQVKGLSYPELVIYNDSKHACLFEEIRTKKVKGIVVKEGEKPSVTLFRLADVPDMLDKLKHRDRIHLKKIFRDIIENFNPSSPLWYYNDADTSGSNTVESQPLYNGNISTISSVDECLPNIVGCSPSLSSSCEEQSLVVSDKEDVNGSEKKEELRENSIFHQLPSLSKAEESRKETDQLNKVKHLNPSHQRRSSSETSDDSTSKESLIAKRDGLLSDLLSNPSPDLIKELEVVLRRLTLFEGGRESKVGNIQKAAEKGFTKNQQVEDGTCVTTDTVKEENRVTIDCMKKENQDSDAKEDMCIIPQDETLEPLRNIFKSRTIGTTNMSSSNVAVISPLHHQPSFWPPYMRAPPS